MQFLSPQLFFIHPEVHQPIILKFYHNKHFFKSESILQSDSWAIYTVIILLCSYFLLTIPILCQVFFFFLIDQIHLIEVLICRNTLFFPTWHGFHQNKHARLPQWHPGPWPFGPATLQFQDQIVLIGDRKLCQQLSMVTTGEPQRTVKAQVNEPETAVG